MKKKIILLALVLLLFSALPLYAEESAAEDSPNEISGTLQATCILKITANPKVLSNTNSIEYILQSSPIGGRLAREILDFHPAPDEPEPFRENINIVFSSRTSAPGDSVVYTARLMIYFPEAQIPAVEEFMYALVEQLRSYIEKEHQQYISILKQNMVTASENARNAEHELRDLQKQLRSISGSYNLDPEDILGNIAGLQEEINDIDGNLREYEFMIDSYSQQIADASRKIEEKLENDEVLNELVNILVFQEQQIKTLDAQFEAGSLGTDKLIEAKEKLARAKIDIAQRKEELRESAGGDKIENLNQRISDISMRQQLDRIKIETIHRQLVDAQVLLQKGDDYEIVGLKTDIAKEAYEHALWAESELRSKMSMVSSTPAIVTIVGAD